MNARAVLIAGAVLAGAAAGYLAWKDRAPSAHRAPGDSAPREPDSRADTAGAQPEPVRDDRDLIVVEAPSPGALVASPLAVSGRARGPWFFEAEFPVRLLDASGDEIAVAGARAQGEWMTREYVPFEASLSFTAPAAGAGAAGTLVIERSNPSGLPENAGEIRIPVRFR